MWRSEQSELDPQTITNHMKYSLAYSLSAAVLWTVTSCAQAQPVYGLDSGLAINDYISLGEFNTNGVNDGWGQNAASIKSEVANGMLKVTTTSGDPWIFKAGLPDLPPEFNMVQVRLRVLKGERSGWEMFWGQTGAAGFSGGRRIGYSLGFDDSEFHILEYDLSPVLEGGSLTDFRIDCGQNAGNVFEVDYVRVGTISPDTDGDGLPDTVETASGVFSSPRDTGSDPNKADSDGDGVSDGIEVSYATDPNDAASFPVPSIDRYSENPAVYISGVAIAPNLPTVSSGAPTSFRVTPNLPAGLSLNPTSGEISGTPSAASPLTDYSVVANFAGDKTATNVLRLEVRNPYIDYTVNSLAFKKDMPIAPFSPDVYGPAPASFSIQPALPEGLLMDESTGEISGVPTIASLSKLFTVTANYPNSLKATADLSIAVLTDPVAVVDPVTNIVEWFSLAEFDDPAEAEAFYRNSVDPFTIDNGMARFVTTGGDPFFGQNLALENDYKVLQFRMKLVEGGVPFRFYWSENAPGRGMSEATAWTMPEANPDGEFHVYQVDFTTATIGQFNALRIDPGDGAGNILEFDYIRMGSMTPMVKPSLSITRQSNGMVRISWPVSATGYALYGTADLVGAWTADAAEVKTDGDGNYIEALSTAAPRYYRLQK